MIGGRRNGGRLSLAITLFVAVSGAPAALAQTTYTWDGGGGDSLWSTGANWAGDAAPVRGSSTFVTFAGSTRLSPFNNQGIWQQLAGMTFASGASGFRIEGDNIGFVNGSGEQVITQNSATTQEISATFSFSPDRNSRINLNAGDLLISSGDVFIDVTSAAARQIFIDGSDGTRRTVTFSGNVKNSGAGQDGDLVILGNKRVVVTGTLLNGNGTDTSVFVNNGVLQFSNAGAMTGGELAIGDESGSGSAAVWLDTAGASFARQLQLRNGSSGRRTVGGLNTSGTVTFSSAFVGSAGEYDLAAATGGATVFSGVRNVTSTVHVNRPDGATTYGGTVVLSGTTNSTGGVGVYGGTLQFSDFNQLGSGYFAFEQDTGDSGTLRYTGGSTSTTRTLWSNKAGQTRAAIDVSEAGTTLSWTQSGGDFNRNLTKVGAGWLAFNGPITGAGGNVAVEAGMLILTGSNSYSGGTVVSGGTLEVSANGSQGGSPAALGTGTVSIASGGQVTYWLSLSGSSTVANPFSLSGGTLHTTDGFNTYSGLVTLASGSSTISAQYEDAVTLSGGLAGSGGVLFTQSGGTGSWAAPTYVLSGTGANTGTVRVSGASGGGATKLQLANVNALQGATLDLATGDVGTVEFTVPGANTYALGGLRGSRNLAVGANSLSVGGNGQSTTYSGALSGSGSLTKVGGGSLTLAGANSYSGTTSIIEGSLYAPGSSLPGPVANAAALYFAQASDGSYAGVISGTGLVVKEGAGSLTLTGTSIYTGPTTVAAGRLAVNGALGNTAVTVQSGAVLGGAGVIGGPVNVLAGGMLAPGNSIASLAAGATTLSGTSTFAYEYDSTAAPSTGADLLVVNGNLTIESGALVTFADTAGAAQAFADGTTFALVNYSGAWNGGVFTYGAIPLNDGNRFFVGGQEWEIDYNRPTSLPVDPVNFTGDYVDGSFIAISAVPEPASLGLAATGGLAALGWTMLRRRKRHAVRAAASLASQPTETAA